MENNEPLPNPWASTPRTTAATTTTSSTPSNTATTPGTNSASGMGGKFKAATFWPCWMLLLFWFT